MIIYVDKNYNGYTQEEAEKFVAKAMEDFKDNLQWHMDNMIMAMNFLKEATISHYKSIAMVCIKDKPFMLNALHDINIMDYGVRYEFRGDILLVRRSFSDLQDALTHCYGVFAQQMVNANDKMFWDSLHKVYIKGSYHKDNKRVKNSSDKKETKNTTEA